MAEAAALAGTVAGGALSIFGQIQQGNTNANIAQYNANVANQSAQVVTAQGDEEAARSLDNSNKMLGADVAAYGAAGVGAGGSASWVLRAGAQQGALNALTIKNNAQIKALAYTNEAALDNYRASNDKTAALIGAIGTGLSTVGSVAGTAAGGSSGVNRSTGGGGVNGSGGTEMDLDQPTGNGRYTLKDQYIFGSGED